MGPTEASAIVSFWRREFKGMRVKGCVDWSTAYTLWRNMLVDYEVRWSEWNPQRHLPPTMWDWQDHTQEIWETMKERAAFVLNRSLMHQWDTKPEIIAEVSTSEAATADPEDTDISAFVSRPSPLDVLAAPVGRKVKRGKHKKARSRKQKQKEAELDSESEESEELSSSSSDDEEFGKPCRNEHGHVYKKCTSCPFYKKYKVCRNLHADAPPGTTGPRGGLTKKSLKKLTRLNAYGGRGKRGR